MSSEPFPAAQPARPACAAPFASTSTAPAPEPSAAAADQEQEGTPGRSVSVGELAVTAKLLLAGGIAGVVSKTATAPLARVTILYQTGAYDGLPRPPTMFAALRDVVQKQGVRGLWKGNGVTIIHRLPYSAINFYTYEMLTDLANQHFPPAEDSSPLSQASILRRLIAGAGAGGIACASAYPLDLARTLLAAELNSPPGARSSLPSVFAGIMAQHGGVRGLYRGLGATLLQVAPNLAINYSVYETLRSHWMAVYPELVSPTIGMSLTAGSVAGLCAATLTFPLDVVRRQMQVQGQSGAGKSYSAVIRDQLALKGVGGFYTGIIPEYCKVAPGVAIAFSTYEAIKYLSGVSRANAGQR